jgi:hypothetical protein
MEMDELDSMELSAHEMACMSLMMMNVMVKSYCDEGYCDPVMYKTLQVGEKLAKKLGELELETLLATTKMFAGEVVNEMIDTHKIDIDKRAWS